MCQPIDGEGARAELGLVPKDINDDDADISGSGQGSEVRVPAGAERVLNAPTPDALSDASACLWRLELSGVRSVVGT